MKKKRMKKKVKEQWIKALRGGKYKKGMGALRTTQRKFCCLGVLCDLYSKEKKVEWGKDIVVGWEFMDQSVILPNEVRIWAGLCSVSGIIRENVGTTSLAELNDDKDKSFKQIADVIENEF